MNSTVNLDSERPRQKVVPRMFPGPAGLLSETQERNPSETVILCSQRTADTFKDAVWSTATEQFGTLMESYDVKSVSETLRGGKVPFLAVKIKEINWHGKTPNFILADPTGEIEAVISGDLYSKAEEFLTVNSVLILQNIGLLSMSTTRKTYLVITSSSLVKVYTPSSEDEIQIVSLIEDFNINDFKTPENPRKKIKTDQSASEPPIVLLSQQNVKPTEAKELISDIDDSNFFDDF